MCFLAEKAALFCKQTHGEHRSSKQGDTSQRVVKPRPSLLEVQRSQVWAPASWEFPDTPHARSIQDGEGLTGPAEQSPCSSPLSCHRMLQEIWSMSMLGAQTSLTKLCRGLRRPFLSCPEQGAATGRCHLWTAQSTRLYMGYHVSHLPSIPELSA